MIRSLRGRDIPKGATNVKYYMAVHTSEMPERVAVHPRVRIAHSKTSSALFSFANNSSQQEGGDSSHRGYKHFDRSHIHWMNPDTFGIQTLSINACHSSHGKTPIYSFSIAELPNPVFHGLVFEFPLHQRRSLRTSCDRHRLPIRFHRTVEPDATLRPASA